MPAIKFESTCFDAWLAGTRHIYSRPGTEDVNLMLVVRDPTVFDSAWFAKIDPRTVAASGENPNDVANTIFPLRTWRNARSRDDLYSRYRRAHQRGGNKRWGTYFLRLTSFGDKGINQLECGITVLNNWKNDPGTAIVFHLSSADTDKPKPIGSPCLQLIQLQARGGLIDMSAIYRNHDYFNKTLPNLIGLSRLLNFICRETGRQAGTLTCLSGHAYSNSTKLQLKRLIDRA
jgi:thymidylate synthase